MAPEYRVSLIGIDDYERASLSGCVSDVDAIEAMLRDRLQVPSERIDRLVAPSTKAATKRPTAAAIRASLKALAVNAREHDRVLIYYSGHGTVVHTREDGALIAREALVPCDYQAAPDGLIQDCELNALLGDIAKRTRDLTVVLDCCHAAGVTRELPDGKTRFLRVERFAQANAPSRGTPGIGDRLLFGHESPYVVIAACGADERARERRYGDRFHGAFTHALLQLLEPLTSERLTQLRWCEVMPELCEHVSRSSPLQHPRLLGAADRLVFGGPWKAREAGYAIRRRADTFEIAGGAHVGLNVGAEVAVYGDEPARFFAIGSADDLAARIGLLQVVAAGPSVSTARSLSGKCDPPPDARGRLVRAGEADKLIACLDPFDRERARSLEASGRLRVVAPGEPGAEVFVRRDSSSVYSVGDDVYGDGRDARPVLVRVSSPALERALLHYARYCRPLRLPRRCRDLPGALYVTLHDAVPGHTPAPTAAATARPPELPRGAESTYVASEGRDFCVSVENRSEHQLECALLNCTASGRVEYLGDGPLPAQGRHIFWEAGQLGHPFSAGLAIDAPAGIDRLVVVATTNRDVSLAHLRVDESLAEVIASVRSRDVTRDVRPISSTPIDIWTATRISLQITRLATAQ